MELRFKQLLESLADRLSSSGYQNFQGLNDNLDYPSVVRGATGLFSASIGYPMLHSQILKESLILRQIAFILYCRPFVKHLDRETYIDLKQEIFNYIEHQIDNYQPPTEPTMLMWYDLAQAFATVREDPTIGIRSTRLYHYTHAKWEADYELVLAKFSRERRDYDFHIRELHYCGDERALPIMEIMVEHNEANKDFLDDNGAGGQPYYIFGEYAGAESARNAILQRVNNINFSSRNLTEIPAIIYESKNLVSLDLSYNKITEIPANIGELTNLNSLNLSCNKIAKISEVITNLEHLTKLDLNGNNIAEIPDAIGKLKNLTHLNLSGNQIVKIPAAIGELENLIYLCLSDNEITEIPIEIGNLKNLTYLILSDNKITVIPQWLQSSKSLKTLTVTGGDNGVDLNMDRSGCSFVIIQPSEEENMWLR